MHKVDITGSFDFSPGILSINVGDTVEWTVTGIGHSTASGTPNDPTGLWDSGFLRVDQSFKFTFNEPGTFSYFCTVHPSMLVTLTVGSSGPGASSSSPPPATTPVVDADDYYGT